MPRGFFSIKGCDATIHLAPVRRPYEQAFSHESIGRLGYFDKVSLGTFYRLGGEENP
jgi:hypothetical protein